MNALIEAVFRPDKTAVVFAIKGVLSMALALFLAMALGLDRPYWAVVSAVFLQVRPETGLVIQKGIIQVGGTIIGSLVGIAILAAFMPYPELALLCIGVWIWINAALSSMVRSINYTYGFAMAGMSAAMVVLLTMADASSASSQTVFSIASSRVAELVLGAGCAVLVSQLIWPVSVKDGLRKNGQVLINKTLKYMELELATDSTHKQRHDHADQILDTLMAITDDASGVAFEGPEGPGRSRAANLMCNRVMSLMANVQILGRFQRQYPDEAHQWYGEWMQRIAATFATVEATRDYEQAHDAARQLRKELRQFHRQFEFQSSLEFRLCKIAIDLVSDLIVTLKAWQAIEQADLSDTQLKAVSIQSYKDGLVAVINATRSVVVFAIGAFIWIQTGATAALMLMIMPVVFSIMFSHLPTAMIPVVVTRLVQGVAVSTVVGLGVLGLLSQSSGDFEILVMVLGMVFFPGLLALANRPTLPYGLGFLIPITIIVQPSNAMTFDVARSLGTAMGIMVGVVILYWVFKIITPAGNKTMQGRLLQSTADDLLELADRDRSEQTEEWFNSRMGDRLLRLALSDRNSGSEFRVMTDLGLTGLNLGHVALRMRRIVQDHSDSPESRRHYEHWLKALASSYLAAAKGQQSPQLAKASERLQAHMQEQHMPDAFLSLIAGMNERLGYTFRRTANNVQEMNQRMP